MRAVLLAGCDACVRMLSRAAQVVVSASSVCSRLEQGSTVATHGASEFHHEEGFNIELRARLNGSTTMLMQSSVCSLPCAGRAESPRSATCWRGIVFPRRGRYSTLHYQHLPRHLRLYWISIKSLDSGKHSTVMPYSLKGRNVLVTGGSRLVLLLLLLCGIHVPTDKVMLIIKADTAIGDSVL